MMNWHLMFLNLTYFISLFLMAAVNLGSFFLGIWPTLSHWDPTLAWIIRALQSLKLSCSGSTISSTGSLAHENSLHFFKVLWQSWWNELPRRGTYSVNIGTDSSCSSSSSLASSTNPSTGFIWRRKGWMQMVTPVSSWKCACRNQWRYHRVSSATWQKQTWDHLFKSNISSRCLKCSSS